MKIWKITTTIETDDNYTRQQVLRQLDLDINSGDGMYILVDKSAKVEMIKKISD